MPGPPIGLQQLMRTQGIEWGDSANGDTHLWIQDHILYTDAALNLAALSFGSLVLTDGASTIVPGATSLSLRNHANNADNLIITDAGLASFRGSLRIAGRTPWVDVTHPAYGAKGDGVTDDTPAFLAAANAAGRGGCVIVPPAPTVGGYIFKTALVLDRTHDWIRFMGMSAAPNAVLNGQGASMIKRGFQGTAILSGAMGTEFHNIGFDCGSPTYTGPMVDLQCPFDPRLNGCSFYNIDTYAVTLRTVVNMNVRMRVSDCFFICTSATIAGIQGPDNTSVTGNWNGVIANCVSGSGPVIDVSDSVNMSIANCDSGKNGVIMNASTLKMAWSGGRMALTGGSLTIDGHDSVIIGCTINGGNVSFAATAVNCVLGPCHIETTYTVIDNNAGANFFIQHNDPLHPLMYLGDGAVCFGHAALATGATTGFTYVVRSMAGTPTGTPADALGSTANVPMVYDTAANKLWARNGGTWRSVTFT